MIANYHTHTPRCHHAVGAEIEYVNNAVEGGLQILGFSDHSPQFFHGDYYSGMRMRPEELKAYSDTVVTLQQKYAGKLQILLGLEAEYYPTIFPELIAALKDSPVTYLLLGQHWNGDEEGYVHNYHLTGDEKQLEQYCDQVIDAIYTGYFTYIAHPDLLNFSGEQHVYDRHMRRICQAAKRCDIPLEINLLGVREQRDYPRPAFWRLAAEENCKVILGSDAHRPEDVCCPQAEKTAMELVQTYGLHLLPTVELRKL